MLPVKLGILPKRSNGLGGEVKGRWSGKQYCRQGKAVEIPVWVCLTAPTGGVASGFLRHWTGPASSTQEFQGFNIYLKTISSDMVHGLARVRTVTNMGSISFLLLLLLVLITTGFYILTHLISRSSEFNPFLTSNGLRGRLFVKTSGMLSPFNSRLIEGLVLDFVFASHFLWFWEGWVECFFFN